ncbi:MAG: urea ABC transporter ATP-binding subunit UrtE [Hahellaceae bacterium]|nr:urea ABC transporter ATP-binding subunit UrtE [Hahellaceae bacterium]
MLQASNINVFYGASQALYNVNVGAAPGKVTCVLGRNGVGKTSLLRTLAGQQPLQSGTMTWEGKDIAKLAPYDRARMGIAIVPQGREIFPQLTVLENLKTGFSCLPVSKRIIPKDIYRLFPVLQSMLHRKGGDLSGGQQQQLAIARALVTQPKLLMLDEPTEGIQPSIIKDIQRVIAELRDRGDMAIVLVEQYLDFAHALADDFIVLERGQVVLSGTGGTMDKEQVRRYMTV